ncbi:hypothetical protein F2P81_023706 [Scophthalmus maximus]|uniref:Uncharacterized protein n=1 Tax=Scophthalmus maximus TaxID=52904 RepID=A0A6A4RKR2_SCOMX|nr:hypothetical protein F2P81_023706 [Scophthalmus maximus]
METVDRMLLQSRGVELAASFGKRLGGLSRTETLDWQLTLPLSSDRVPVCYIGRSVAPPVQMSHKEPAHPCAECDSD